MIKKLRRWLSLGRRKRRSKIYIDLKLIINVKKIIVLLILFVLVAISGCAKNYLNEIRIADAPKENSYEYEICDENHNCKMVSVDKIIQPSKETRRVCKDDGSCEDVPVNRLLLKHGTDKKYCNNAPYLSDDYVDNWWNANGLIDECEMPPKADMQFAFKQHNQSFLSHTGTVQITIVPISYNDNYLALQILIGEDKNNDNLPDGWIFCGNVDSINGKDKRIINCKGTMVEFVKLVNPEWNPSSLYFDYILVLTADEI